MGQSDTPRFVLNGEVVSAGDVPPTTTLLDWLRERARLRGTKEGCAEGDCGACTVVLEHEQAGAVERVPVNACLMMIGQVDGFGVRTVEGLASSSGALHPVQTAFVEAHASQCGFCTPGFIMSAFAFAAGKEEPHTDVIHDALAGNLCRCTGYRPIVAAMAAATDAAASDSHADAHLLAALRRVRRTHRVVFEQPGSCFEAPRSLHEALKLRAAHPDAVLLAGGTDLGLLASKRREPPRHLLHLSNVVELGNVDEREDALNVGASVTYTRLSGALIRRYPNLSSYITRLGSRQIRNLGTVAGNIGTASPIGDMSPILLALGARVVVASAARGEREIAVEDFFTGYRQTALARDELIVRIVIPHTDPALVHADKISKRRDQDISSVCGAYCLEMNDERISRARLAFGGLASTPKRAFGAERALCGQRLDERAVEAACAGLREEFKPISDWRAGAEYRLLVAQNLIRRLRLRLTEPETLVEIDHV